MEEIGMFVLCFLWGMVVGINMILLFGSYQKDKK